MNRRDFRQDLPELTLAFLLAALLVLPACDDPSNVGIGLVEQQSGETTVETIEATSITASSKKDVTGGSPFGGATNALAGTVTDPVFGMLIAEGYVDFLPAEIPESDFRSGDVNFAELTLSIDYAYGDTTTEASFELYNMVDEWEASGRHADTTLTIGTLATSFTANATDNEVRVQLSDAWITDNSSALQSEDFASAFNGFAIRSVGGNVVLGFESSSSELLVATADADTARFQITKRLTATSRTGEQVPDGRILIQDGFESAAEIQFPLGTGGLDAAAIHRTSVRIMTAEQFAPEPPEFSRPGIPRIGLRAVSTEGNIELTLSVVDVTGDEIIFDNDVIADVFQSAAFNRSNLDRFEIFVPASSAGIGFFLLDVPVADVTLTPID